MPSAFSEISTTNSALLNLIRFLCSQGVVVGHALGFLHLSHRYIGGLASYCVILFFILSGFLISYSLMFKMKTVPNYDFKLFFLDRFFRIFPPFIGSLILVLVLDTAAAWILGTDLSVTMYIKNFVVNLFQLQGYPMANILYQDYGIDFFYFRHFGSNFPLWTISIEWWLYMFYGFFIFYFVKSNQIKLIHWLLLLFLLITPIYYLLVSTRLERGITAFWFLGTLITYAFVYSSRLPKRNPIVFTTSLLLILVGMYGYYSLGYNTAALMFFIGLFMIILFSNRDIELLSKRFSILSEVLASYSYSLYLIHYPVMVFIIGVFKPSDNFLSFIVLLIVSNIAAYLFAGVFEANSKKMKFLYENYRSNKD